jgi:isopropylmalate/homocitrate/citramalate synthase
MQVRAGFHIKPNLILADCTLRDGEQQPGVVFRKEEKIRIAELLDTLGVHEIEAGMPAVSKEDADAIQQISGKGLKAKITALARAVKEDIDIVADLGCWGVILSLPAGFLQLKHKLRWSENRVIETALAMTEYAHEKNLHVTISPYDTTRADLDFLDRYLRAIVAGGNVNRVRLVDTTGAIMPRAIGFLVDRMRRSVGDLPIEVHCHNDFGLATATTLAAVEAGVDVVSTTMNGLGERAGNTATEEVVVALRVLYGIDLGIALDKIGQISREVERISGVKLQPHKSLVGKNAFSHESGLVIGGILNNPFTGESLAPELVGRSRRIVIGKKSGLASIKAKLKEIDLEDDINREQQILQKVKQIALDKKGSLSDSEFRKIVEETRV